LNPELLQRIAQWERDPLLFESDQLLQRFEALDFIDRHLPEGGASKSDREAANAVEAAELRSRVNTLRARLEAANESVFERMRAEVRRGERPEAFLRAAHRAQSKDWVTAREQAGYGFLDELISGVFRFDEPDDVPAFTDPELVAYQPTPARHIFELIETVELRADDLLVDIGSGLGHVPLMVSICTPASGVGIEREAAYVRQARLCAERLNLRGVEFVEQDAREADLSAGTVFYLYTPFTGSILRAVLARLYVQARVRPIRICTYGPCTPMVARERWLEARSEPGAEQVAVFRSRIGG
jgi:hypothetical protein